MISPPWEERASAKPWRMVLWKYCNNLRTTQILTWPLHECSPCTSTVKSWGRCSSKFWTLASVLKPVFPCILPWVEHKKIIHVQAERSPGTNAALFTDTCMFPHMPLAYLIVWHLSVGCHEDLWDKMVTKSSLLFYCKFCYTTVSCRVYLVLGPLVCNKNKFRRGDFI